MISLDIIREAWSWVGLTPDEIVVTNAFGNIVVRASDRSYWRICPEEWSCTRIAGNAAELESLMDGEDFQLDWQMTRLVELARQKLGVLTEGRCYCLKRPAIIGGNYEADNLGTISVDELIAFSGDMARQIQDVADGDQIKIEWV
jgi:hypothetical protein